MLWPQFEIMRGLMKKLFCLALVITGTGSNLETGHAQSDYVLPACDLTIEKTVHWKAAQHDVTLRVEIKGESGSLPSGNSYLTFSDGTEIHLGEGGKYLDDFTADNVPTCEDHLKVLMSPILESMKPVPPAGDSEIRTMGEMAKILTLAENCQDEDRYVFGHLHCQDVKWTAENYREYSEISSEDFDRLVGQNAPLITVPYSTYGTDFYAVDIQNKKLYSMTYSGC